MTWNIVFCNKQVVSQDDGIIYRNNKSFLYNFVKMNSKALNHQNVLAGAMFIFYPTERISSKGM